MNIRKQMHLRPLAERFAVAYCAEPMGGCWLWEGQLYHGYGRIKIDKRQRYAHRVAWELLRGPIPPDMEICHACDVKCCVNPAHLFVGTHYDNMMDAWRKGITKQPPTQKGERHAMSKLQPQQVLEIRARFAAGETAPLIAKDYGITNVNVRHIGNGKTWRHL